MKVALGILSVTLVALCVLQEQRESEKGAPPISNGGPSNTLNWTKPCAVGQYLTGSGGCETQDLTEFTPDLPQRMRLNRFVTSANFDEVWMQAVYRAESGSAPETYVGDPYSCNPASDGAMGVNGTSYRCNHRTKRWEVDTDAIAAENREEKHKRKLAWALQSRVLTDAEMGEVADLGINLFTSDMVPYQETEVQKTLNEALLQQSRLRSSARRQ